MKANNTLVTSSSSMGSTETNNSNYKDAKDVKFTAKEMYYYRAIDKFYRKVDNDKIKLMINIIYGNSEISLRLLDWFVTKYADQNVIKIKQDDGEKLNIHISYKAQLKSFKKRYFDPFRRLQKFYYNFGKNNQKLLTTIGQLNFFKWAFRHNIIKYVQSNFNKLSTAMIISNKEDKLKKKKKKENIKNRKTETKLKIKGITITAKKAANSSPSERKIIVSFD